MICQAPYRWPARKFLTVIILQHPGARCARNSHDRPTKPLARETPASTEQGKARRDRLHAAWRLSLYGLRRGEVLGLRWSDIDLKAKTLTVSQARVLVEYRVRIEEPKSRNGRRTLPLDDELLAALTLLRKIQMEESPAAGTAYRAGLTDLGWYRGGE